MRLKIYLVEDNILIRDNMVAMLDELLAADVVGWTGVETDANGWMATHPQDWDLAVIDLFLHQGNGMGVLKNCTPRSPCQKIVVLTNYATPAVREHCLALGANAVFDKSTELDEFMQYALQMQLDMRSLAPPAPPMPQKVSN